MQSAIADTGSGLLEFLPALGSREAIAFGDGMTLPVRIKFDELPKHALPRSSTARFSEKWNQDIGDDAFLNNVVERWRASGNHAPAEDLIANEAEIAAQQTAAAQAAAHQVFVQQAASQQAAQAAVYTQAPARPAAAAMPQRAQTNNAGAPQANGYGAQQGYHPQQAPAFAQAMPQQQQPAYEHHQQPAMAHGYAQNAQPNFGHGFAPQQANFVQAGVDPYAQPTQQTFAQPAGQPQQGYAMAAPAAPRVAGGLLRRQPAEQAAAPTGGLLKRPGGLGGLLRRRDPQ